MVEWGPPLQRGVLRVFEIFAPNPHYPTQQKASEETKAKRKGVGGTGGEDCRFVFGIIVGCGVRYKWWCVSGRRW